MARPDHPAIVAGAGAGFVLAGAALLLQELGLLVTSWSLLLPLILVTIGLIVAVSGAAGAHRERT